jgi:hypothetical protein
VTMTLTTYPLDLARTRVTADMSSGDRQFNGLFDCLGKTWRTEGSGALYKGLLPSLSSIIPYIGIGFTLYDELKLWANPDGPPSFGARLLAGAGSGVVAQSATYPIDTVRRKMQMDGQLGTPRLYKAGSLDCAVQLYRVHGVGVFYRGLLVNAIKTTPGAAIQFAAYDMLKGLSVP